MSDLAKIAIRQMQLADIPFAASCTAGEGWASEDLVTLEGFFQYDPHGCLVADINGQSVGMCIATKYGYSGFIGELIVRPEARGKGIGGALLDGGVKYLLDNGAKTVYLDGVLKAVELYERHGFRKLCRSWRFSGHLEGSIHPFIRRMDEDDLEQVATLDQQYFGEDRLFFVQRRVELFPNLSYVLEEAGKITGYILGREGSGWISAGPWVAKAQALHTLDLLRAFATESGDRAISIGILDINQQACQMVQTLGLRQHADSPWRMAFGPSSDLGASPHCFAVGSAAKG